MNFIIRLRLYNDKNTCDLKRKRLKEYIVNKFNAGEKGEKTGADRRILARVHTFLFCLGWSRAVKDSRSIAQDKKQS